MHLIIHMNIETGRVKDLETKAECIIRRQKLEAETALTFLLPNMLGIS